MAMKKRYLFPLLLGFMVACGSKNTGEPDDSGLYIKLIGGGKGEKINDAFLTAQGEVIGVGSARSFSTLGTASNHIFVFKADANGNKVWQKAVEGLLPNLTIEGNAITPTKDGGMTIVATSTEALPPFKESMYFIKVNAEGIKQKNADPIINTNGIAGVAVSELTDESCIALGNYKGERDSEFNVFRTLNYFVRYSQASTFKFHKIYASENYTDNTPMAMKPTGNNKVIVSGSVNNQPRLILVNDELGIEWDYAYSGLGVAAAKDVLVVSSGYVMTGITAGKSPFLIKTNFAGTMEWQKVVGATNITEINSIAQAQDGGYVLTGTLQTTNGEANHTEVWVGKVNSAGELEWQKTFGGRKNDSGKTVRVTEKGDYVVLCNVNYEESAMVGLLKLDKNGNLVKE
jgi:hypothetical protein